MQDNCNFTAIDAQMHFQRRKIISNFKLVSSYDTFSNKKCQIFALPVWGMCQAVTFYFKKCQVVTLFQTGSAKFLCQTFMVFGKSITKNVLKNIFQHFICESVQSVWCVSNNTFLDR